DWRRPGEGQGGRLTVWATARGNAPATRRSRHMQPPKGPHLNPREPSTHARQGPVPPLEPAAMERTDLSDLALGAHRLAPCLPTLLAAANAGGATRDEGFSPLKQASPVPKCPSNKLGPGGSAARPAAPVGRAVARSAVPPAA